ncbi:hypothetical protein TNCV_1581851 [Trichonephila clavipes]|nr:hypothetical protein TNCV_1581851 [Trichonephila clavipes]
MYRDEVTTPTDLVDRLFATCTSVDTALLLRIKSPFSQCTQDYLDMHSGHFAFVNICKKRPMIIGICKYLQKKADDHSPL